MNGFKVIVRFTPESYYKGATETYHNVTEIHYKYPSPFEDSVAFESDIHQTGCNHRLKIIAEFEVFPEIELSPEF